MKIINITAVPSVATGGLNQSYKIFGLGDDSKPYIWRDTQWVLYSRNDPSIHAIEGN